MAHRTWYDERVPTFRGRNISEEADNMFVRNAVAHVRGTERNCAHSEYSLPSKRENKKQHAEQKSGVSAVISVSFITE
jgi:hypothetical protein